MKAVRFRRGETFGARRGSALFDRSVVEGALAPMAPSLDDAHANSNATTVHSNANGIRPSRCVFSVRKARVQQDRDKRELRRPVHIAAASRRLPSRVMVPLHAPKDPLGAHLRSPDRL
jgi:hypothetical protein